MLRSTLLAFLLIYALPAPAQDATAVPESAASVEPSTAGESAGNAPPTGLLPRQERMLRSGHGMGLARAAELNGYPGPRHVLQQADALDLTDEQRAATSALVERVRSDAVALGQRILDAEAELHAMFATDTSEGRGAPSPDAVEAQLAEIAELSAELRAVHLLAHLEQAALLTEAQKAAYRPMYGDARERRRGRGAGNRDGD
ncbi:hypothetical protein [Halomonas denitrificans]|nr:hypothetical protein [Halomonas denitrificans]